MNTYFKVIATIDGQIETLFGSFVKSDCTYEVDAERDTWRGQGYKGIKIISEETAESPDPEVYAGQVVTAAELFQQQAPSFNFEFDADQLVAHGLEVGFITKIDGKEDLYLINSDYEGIG